MGFFPFMPSRHMVAIVHYPGDTMAAMRSHSFKAMDKI